MKYRNSRPSLLAAMLTVMLLPLLTASLISHYWPAPSATLKLTQHIILPTPLPKSGDIDFSPIEPVLEEIIKHPKSNLHLSPEWVNDLDRITRPYIDQPLTPEQMERITFLIHKSLPADRAELITSIFQHYLHYQRERSVFLQQHQDPNDTPEARLIKHKQLVSLRDNILGKGISRVLFNERDRLTEHLIQRQITQLKTAPHG